MEKLTQAQIDEIMAKVEVHIEIHPYIRKGQAFFNILHGMYQEHAESIRATKYDPFHVDDKLYPCIAYLTDTTNEDVNPILEDIDDIVDRSMDVFWNTANGIIFEDYSHCTDAQRDEAYEKVSEALKKSL